LLQKEGIIIYSLRIGKYLEGNGYVEHLSYNPRIYAEGLSKTVKDSAGVRLNCSYRHVTRLGARIHNWLYWNLIKQNCK
jgi:hypothetical protein